jgi:hypothetical protein
MNHRQSASFGIVAVALLAGSMPTLAQDAGAATAADFNDPEFWSIVDAGPANSDELRRVVATYAAYGMSDEAASAFASYLSREDAPNDPYCEFCQALFSAGHRTDESSPYHLFIRPRSGRETDIFVVQSA